MNCTQAARKSVNKNKIAALMLFKKTPKTRANQGSCGAEDENRTRTPVIPAQDFKSCTPEPGTPRNQSEILNIPVSYGRFRLSKNSFQKVLLKPLLHADCTQNHCTQNCKEASWRA